MGYERIKVLQKVFKKLTPEYAKKIDSLMTKIRKVSNDESEKIMKQINKLINGYGVFPIRINNNWSRYWGDTIAIYVNKGDTYNSTILFNTKTKMPMITTMGDFVEKNTSRYGIL